MYVRGYWEYILNILAVSLTGPEIKKNRSRRRSRFRGSKSPEKDVDNLTSYPTLRQLDESTFKNRTGCY